MSNLREKIVKRIDEIEDLMNENRHLDDAEGMTDLIENVSKFWSVLSEEDRDFIQACQWAIEEKQVWKDFT